MIDGKLDAGLEKLEAHTFPVRQPSGTLPTGFSPTYRVGYSADAFYLYIETPQASLVTRDRAYQNGDGVILVLALPRSDGKPAEEFSVLGFTASGKPLAPWQKQFRWYYNKDLSFAGLPDAEIASASAGGKTGIEIRVPWRSLTPLHPWLTPIGFNLAYVKADGATDVSNFLVVDDDRIQSEQSPRNTDMLRFAPPSGDAPQLFVAAPGHADIGTAVAARLAAYVPQPREITASVRLLNGEHHAVAQAQSSIALPAGLSVHPIALPITSLPSGEYAVTWDGDLNGQGEGGLTLLPPYDVAKANARLQVVTGRLAPGSLTTLQFRLDDIAAQRAKRPSYQTAQALRLAITDADTLLSEAEHGRDVLAAQTGILRRAFRSGVDGTLQPYTVRVPAHFIPGRKYPLIVFLHGSGEDDHDAIVPDVFPDDAIIVAPFGRGTSNAFTADHAQDDIREAVEDVEANYPIDRARVIVSGFSMGGYGAYRTFDADRQRYRGVAIFAGHPSLGRMWIGADAPDYREPGALKAFHGAPVFVFHGGKDRNCPIELTREMIGKLKKAGARVRFEYVPDKGHVMPPAPVAAAFRSWMNDVLR
jgi:Dipeptidyl aminopeptidases/acylaminoacyl-peptidases